MRSIMTAYNRLNGTYCGEHPWLISEVLRGEWGFDGVVISDWFGTHSAVASLRAGLDLEMPGPPRERGVAPAPRRRRRRAVTSASWTRPWPGCWRSASGPAPRPRAPTRSRPTIRAHARAHPPRRGPSDGAAEERGRPAAAGRHDPDASPSIGPYARYGRPAGRRQRAASGPTTDGVRSTRSTGRGFDVTFEPGGSIAKYLPTVRGDFAATFADPSGRDATAAVGRLAWYWDRPPAAGVDVRGVLRRRRGHVRPRRDRGLGDRRAGGRPGHRAARRRAGGDDRGEPHAGAPSSAWAARRCAARSELEEGRPYELRSTTRPVRRASGCVGLVVGARRVPAGDHIERAVAVAAVPPTSPSSSSAPTTTGRPRARTAAGLALPLDQDELVAAVVAANPNTIVVLNTGAPVTMPWLAEAPAVLQLWFPGQEIGDALVDVLTGDAEPGGRLPVTFPGPPRGHAGVRRTTPGRDGRADVRRGAVHRPPLVRPPGHRAAVPVRVRARLHDVRAADGGGRRWGRARASPSRSTLRNTGGRDGGEVVQVYVEPPAGDPARPLRHLAGFARADARRRRAKPRSPSSSTGGRSPRGSTATGSSRRATTSSTSAAHSRDLRRAGVVTA